MKAFIAVLLVAAVSGQYATSGVEKSIVDYLRNRNAYNVGTLGDRSVYPVSSYAKYIQQAFAGLVGNDVDFTSTGYFPYGQQLNVPSDVYTPTTSYYTLSQLYASPIFQQYLDLPFFRLYVTYPAFQRYLVSSYFQQYWTQPIFKKFFAEPALFYKYIYPVVAQFQTTGNWEQVITVPEVYKQYVPEYFYNYINKYNSNGVDTTFARRSFYPSTYSTFKPEFYNRDSYLAAATYAKQLSGYNWEKPTVTGYNWEKPTMTGYNYPLNKFENMNVNDIEAIRKVLYPQTMEKTFNYNKLDNMNVNDMEVIRKVLFPQTFEKTFNYNKFDNMNVNDVEAIRKVLYPQTMEKTFNKFDNMNVNDMDVIRKVLFPQTFEKTFNYPKNMYNTNAWFNTINAEKKNGLSGYETKYVPFTAQENNFNTPQWALEKIFKDLVEGKVNIDEYKQTPVVHDTLKNVVDPITGEMKIVEEKIVKPIDTTFETELTKDALRKVILKKEIFNKV